jgi:hypothetical protein
MSASPELYATHDYWPGAPDESGVRGAVKRALVRAIAWAVNRSSRAGCAAARLADLVDNILPGTRRRTAT